MRLTRGLQVFYWKALRSLYVCLLACRVREGYYAVSQGILAGLMNDHPSRWPSLGALTILVWALPNVIPWAMLKWAATKDVQTYAAVPGILVVTAPWRLHEDS